MADWQKAYEQHGAALLAYFARRLRRPQDAEDLCQETFRRVLEREGRLGEVERIRPFLFTAARNVLINHVTRKNVVRSVSDLDEHDLERAVDRNKDDPEAAVRWRELSGRLESLLGELPEEHRLAFELGVLQRLLYSEIASRTGWSLAKVKVNVYRARKVLIEGLRDFREEQVPKRTEGRKEGS